MAKEKEAPVKEGAEAPVKYELKYSIFMKGKLVHSGFFAKEDIEPDYYKHFKGLEKEAAEIEEAKQKAKWEKRAHLVGIEVDRRKKIEDIAKEVKKAKYDAKIQAL